MLKINHIYYHQRLLNHNWYKIKTYLYYIIKENLNNLSRSLFRTFRTFRTFERLERLERLKRLDLLVPLIPLPIKVLYKSYHCHKSWFTRFHIFLCVYNIK